MASASLALTLPYERPLNLPFQLPGDDEQTQRITNAIYVSPGFFETLEIPLLQGRGLEDGDRSGRVTGRMDYPAGDSKLLQQIILVSQGYVHPGSGNADLMEK